MGWRKAGGEKEKIQVIFLKGATVNIRKLLKMYNMGSVLILYRSQSNSSILTFAKVLGSGSKVML